MKRAGTLAVSALAALAGCTGAPEPEPGQWPIARIEIERALPTDDPAEATYRQHCLPCHGVDGRGAGGTLGADLTAIEGPLRRSDDELIASIRDGRRGAIGLMPAHGPILGEARIVEVLGYVRRQFGAPTGPAADGATAEEAPPSTPEP